MKKSHLLRNRFLRIETPANTNIDFPKVNILRISRHKFFPFIYIFVCLFSCCFGLSCPSAKKPRIVLFPTENFLSREF
jgi:hypothetical protein